MIGDYRINNAGDHCDYNDLLKALRGDLEPVGALEVLLVQKIGACLWKQRRGLSFEAGAIGRQFYQHLINLERYPRQTYSVQLGPEYGNMLVEDIPTTSQVLREHTDDLFLPNALDLNRLLRYGAANDRELYRALQELDRRQRARKGESIPPSALDKKSG